jgi:hypothetical protein
MSTHDLLAWADDAGLKMLRVFDDISSERDPVVRIYLLNELKVAITSMQVVTERLLDLEFMLD